MLQYQFYRFENNLFSWLQDMRETTKRHQIYKWQKVINKFYEMLVMTNLQLFFLKI